ncbi:hypothetical protein EJ03DRAFT_154810 [Teratosphaeria nubilosa]|uniref:Uncharacterized protein n=1 Tax=Teratosphaeria nubilosa TaxID=161662 RepID=A0A6G1LJU1_9PEZI|nr:hypothetical protein EJ03DRAFT_154810 [Teratosphaeria nubilosa]
MTLGGLALAFIAIFLPPLAVVIRAGCGTYFLLSIVLLFLGWIPAVLFAWFVIIDKPSLRQRHRMRRATKRARSRSVGSAGPSVSYVGGGGGGGGGAGRASYGSARGFAESRSRSRSRSRARTRSPEMTEWQRRSVTSKSVYSRR